MGEHWIPNVRLIIPTDINVGNRNWQSGVGPESASCNRRTLEFVTQSSELES